MGKRERKQIVLATVSSSKNRKENKECYVAGFYLIQCIWEQLVKFPVELNIWNSSELTVGSDYPIPHFA